MCLYGETMFHLLCALLLDAYVLSHSIATHKYIYVWCSYLWENVRRTKSERKKECFSFSQCCLRLCHNLFARVIIDSYQSCLSFSLFKTFRSTMAVCLSKLMLNWLRMKDRRCSLVKAEVFLLLICNYCLRDGFFWVQSFNLKLKWLSAMVWHVFKFISLCFDKHDN